MEFDHITTKGGDGGTTSLMNGERRSKADLVFEVLGDVDELSSSLGWAASVCKDLARQDAGGPALFAEAAAALRNIQRDLVILGGGLADTAGQSRRPGLGSEHLQRIESMEKVWMQDLDIRGFILPGFHALLGPLDLARCICRRAERHLVRYIQESWQENLGPSQVYLNRLSDLLFVIGRRVAAYLEIDET